MRRSSSSSSRHMLIRGFILVIEISTNSQRGGRGKGEGSYTRLVASAVVVSSTLWFCEMVDTTGVDVKRSEDRGGGGGGSARRSGFTDSRSHSLGFAAPMATTGARVEEGGEEGGGGGELVD